MTTVKAARSAVYARGARRRRRRAGFTLVEIMIAVILVGILLAIALPAVATLRGKAQRKEAESRLEMLAAAIRNLAWDTGMWPGGLDRGVSQNPETWDLTTADAGLLANDGDFENWQGPYLPSIVLDPWGSPYFFDPDYRIGSVNRVVVGSFGPNRRGRNIYDSDNVYVLLD